MAKKPKKLGKDKTLEQWLIPKLRNLSRQWPMKGVAQARARVRVESGEFFKNGNPIIISKYKCDTCKELFLKEEMDCDHVIPIVDLDGFTNWDDYITNLFCSADNLSMKCKPCHFLKTQLENQERAEKRKAKKLAEKSKKDEDLY